MALTSCLISSAESSSIWHYTQDTLFILALNYYKFSPDSDSEMISKIG